jgi:hypothetical protein
MSEIEAAKAIEAFFEAFNAHNGEAHLNTHHFPHIRINDKGQVRIVQKASEYQPLDSVLEYLTKHEGWHHSTLDSVEVIHASPVKVHFNIQFSRYKADGFRYAVHKSLWIVVKKEDRWGILARSSYAP